jgi:hypothetical protein
MTFSGTSASSVWATSFWSKTTSDVGSTDPDGLADAAWTTFSAGPLLTWKPLNSAGTSITQLQVDFYHPGSNASYQQGVHTVSGGAGNATTWAPASQAIVATLYSAGVGKTSRGRMYWPATAAVSASPAFQYLAAVCQVFSDDLASFLAGVGGLYGAWGVTGAVASVSSGGSTLSGGPGPALYPVTRVGIDTQPDRQEHRERGIPFSRVFSTV